MYTILSDSFCSKEHENGIYKFVNASQKLWTNCTVSESMLLKVNIYSQIETS